MQIRTLNDCVGVVGEENGGRGAFTRLVLRVRRREPDLSPDSESALAVLLSYGDAASSRSVICRERRQGKPTQGTVPLCTVLGCILAGLCVWTVSAKGCVSLICLVVCSADSAQRNSGGWEKCGLL